ncbi:phage tail tape measure protein, lambda family [Meinhardsimonia xiamenensis]|jgi:hypothetical protein|uniref:Phage tail tape measure protein, lambda family n=1 Tax=Meinhardsimonia xiamenensis TaxID=990712 RepID=A0A1G9HCB8_9RHOB|nr:phage tail tape measure C-terminal domain-containing protein [Meinhardsimonia xiamenensis]PRX28673.1 lambda family phage tail tape measure protein [Meinhardsimonia xiamenensis]SDL10559.1 phage tail tape measure protein, lambda family [Meinhardsimonia xiamenensis]
MAEHRVSVRLAATGGREVRAEFRGIGEEGSRSFAMVGREIDSLNRRMGGLGLGAHNARGAMRNVGLQLSQVAQQGAVTGDYFRALAVQMPDLLLGFGGLGIAIGAVAAVLGPFVIDLFEAADRSKELAESVGALEAAVGAFATRAREAGASTAELARTYGTLAGQARELLAVERDLARLDALEQIAASAEAVRAALGDIGTRSRAEFAQAAARVAEVNAEIERLRDEQRALLREGLDVGDNVQRNLAISTALAELQNGLLEIGSLTGPIYRLRDALGITFEDAAALAGAMADLRDARGIEAQSRALEALRASYIAALGGLEAMTAEQRAFLARLTDASLAAIRFRALMDDAGASVSTAAGSATALADEIGRAAANAASLAAEGLSALAESEIRLRYRDDPVGLAGALAGARFDARLGDIIGFDPILQEGLRRQREAFVENARAAARNRLALQEWNREQRAAATASSATRAALEEQAKGWEAVAESLAAYAEEAGNWGGQLGDAFVGAFRSAEDAVAQFVSGAKLEIGDLVGSILADFARLATRQWITGPLATLLGGALGGLGGATGAVLHAGGMVGAGGPQRALTGALWATAPRLHTGGWPGLRPDEVPAILQRGERVLSRREVAAGFSAAAPVQVTIMARDVEGFRQSRAQIAADIARAVSLGRRGL